ncbi:MAG: hypothetical protein JWN20_2578 [Jatrophihabitantaceae bacterium]|nr:hypothetical protein [Jatrophihabitantaceae bacterium]
MAAASPAAVLAAVAASRQDDGWFAARALLMLHPTPGPWRDAVPQIGRLLAGQPGATLLAAFAEVPAAAVRRLVTLRAIATGIAFDGADRPPWLDLLGVSEKQATEAARAAAATLRADNDEAAISDLLAQICVATKGRRRALFDRLAISFAGGHRAGAEPTGTNGQQQSGDPTSALEDLIKGVDRFIPPPGSRLSGYEKFWMPIEDGFAINGRGTVYHQPVNRRIQGVPADEQMAEMMPPDQQMAEMMPLPEALQDEPMAEALPDALQDERMAEALPADDPPPDEPVAARRLQVQLTDVASNKLRTKAFRPGAQHRVEVVLSPEALAGHLVGPALDEGGIAFVAPEGGGPAVAALTVQFVSDAFGQTTTVSQPIALPRTGASTTATFNLIVDAGADSVTCSVLLFQGAALLQSALITGPVSTRDRAFDGSVLLIVADGEFVAVVGPTPALPMHPVQSSVSTHIGRPGEALVVGDEGRAASVVSLPGAAVLRGQITEALRTALDADSLSTTAAGRKRAAVAQVRLLRSLAKFGNLLFQDLPPSVQALGQQQTVQLICGSDDIVPFEIVYDFGFPTATARLCPEWQKALSSGKCTCTPVDGQVKTICPLGFWGLRLVIERQVADSSATEGASATGLPSLGRNTLRPMDRVLFAASQKVDFAPGDPKASAIAATVAVLTERLGKSNVAYVRTWPTWRTTIERRQPGLILALPHTDRDSNDLPRLEIGRGRLLPVGALDPSYVLGPDPTPAEVGPVVFLLGCNTANEALPWYTAAAAFRRRGAAVVVGTLSEALGRQTAPMTRLLADLLWGAPGTTRITAETLGDIMLLIRRRLVAEGMTLGMSLVAFGHAGWMLHSTPPVAPGR